MDRLISEQKVLDILPKYRLEESTIAEEIKAIPSAGPKTGHWIDDTSLGYHVSICSKCNWRGHGDTCLIYKPKYCPNCGAKMQAESEKVNA